MGDAGIAEFRQVSGLVKETKEDTKSALQGLVYLILGEEVNSSVLWRVTLEVMCQVRFDMNHVKWMICQYVESNGLLRE